MIRNISLGIIHFILIVAVQIFVLNNLQLFGYVNPMLYLWFIIMLPVNTPKWLTLILSFILGFTIDIFSGEMGFHTLVMVLIGFIRPFFIHIFFSGKDTDEDTRPSISQIGIYSFIPFVAILVFIHHFLYFTLEIFSFSEFPMTLLRILLSTLATILIILLCDVLFLKTKK